jgi:hypothetical protein
MKKTLWIIALLLFQFSNAQIVIKGTVSSKKAPLEGAAVYINNSSIGTTTNAKGYFELTLKPGSYDIVVSYLGYTTISTSLSTSNYSKPFLFILTEEASTLDEIVIRNTVYNQDWKYNLSEFKRSFIGFSSLAKDCEILNPKVLHFEFDPLKVRLEAFAKEPLKIRHKSLGYLITYDLVSFSLEKNVVTYLGYTKYENLKGGKSKRKKWKKNRLKAYNGSREHFFKSLLENRVATEGFIINQFRRVLNPERPSDEEIRAARLFLRSKGTVNYAKKVTIPKTAIDSALVVVRKSRFSKYLDYLYKKNVPLSEIITKKSGKHHLVFKDYLSIVYTKEKEDIYYTGTAFSTKKRTRGPQTSAIVIVNKSPYIEASGQVINPLDIFYEGYWGYEKMAETLPLDYNPAD